MTAGCPVVEAWGAEGFGAGGTGYSTEHFAAVGTGAEDAGNSVVGVSVMFWGCIPCVFCKFPSPVLLSVFFFILANGAKWSPCAILCSLSGVDHGFRDDYYLGWCFCLHGRDRCV